MSDEKHPTNPEWVMNDPLLVAPPKGVELLLANEGGSLIKGPWYEGALCWALKPKVPPTVKARITGSMIQIGDEVGTNFNKNVSYHTVIDRKRGASQSGLMVRVRPPLHNGNDEMWTDVAWFKKVIT